MRSQAFERKNVFAERTTKVAEAMAQLCLPSLACGGCFTNQVGKACCNRSGLELGHLWQTLVRCDPEMDLPVQHMPYFKFLGCDFGNVNNFINQMRNLF